LGDEIKNNETARARGLYREGRDVVYRVWWGEMREIDHIEDLGVNGSIILKLIFKK
jgi:hypothetical protein